MKVGADEMRTAVVVVAVPDTRIDLHHQSHVRTLIT